MTKTYCMYFQLSRAFLWGLVGFLLLVFGEHIMAMLVVVLIQMREQHHIDKKDRLKNPTNMFTG